MVEALKMVADTFFRVLIRRGSFPECWRSANVTAIPQGAMRS